MKPKFASGAIARGEFERTMTALFRVPKRTDKDKPKLGSKEPKKSGKT